jgi:LmbE family N-acetylglucosaminyl deacetylase
MSGFAKMPEVKLDSTHRLLVCAPHPDDETLAAGELIQLARAAGAEVRVIFATDGDNNPWPQRWLERRWRIGADERARWGARRRREAVAALGALGIEDAARAVRFLGWPDQGLTDALMRDGDAVAVLTDEVARFMPTHVALPALSDRHPDHSALRVMLDLALLRAGSACVRLGYVVHAKEQAAIPLAVPADAARHQRKQQAMLAHASQIALSRGRLLQLAARPEHFEMSDPAAMAFDRAAQTVRVAHGPDWMFRRRHEVLLVIASAAGDLRFRAALPKLPHGQPALLTCSDGTTLAVEWSTDALSVTLPTLASPPTAVFAKLDRVRPRLIVFDRERWHDAAQLLRGAAPSPAGGTAEGLA